ncbi:IclR family transcriptional regulator [Nocardioides luteus]|uniref:Transcriptional regulator n=1 Tax=Nocardioides luteus TaxID=1844 RepID=A0A1J4N8S1_9ACTN|nr:helix-turn-helix domain-containing protein [Nocardioides luteus]OIJ27915.1 transcriptional regulator [Nocardioides luteus]
MATLQGLDRGLAALAYVSQHPAGVTVADVAAHLGVDRAIAYRIVATLEARALVAQGVNKRLRLGAGVIALAGRFQPQLVRAAEPALQDLADAVGAPAFLTVAHGEDECVPVLEADPQVGQGPVRVGYRIGLRYPLDKGASGIAILALAEPAPADSSAVREARELGYSHTAGELQRGAVGIAVGFEAPGPVRASVGIVTMDELDPAEVGPLVGATARQLAQLSSH